MYKLILPENRCLFLYKLDKDKQPLPFDNNGIIIPLDLEIKTKEFNFSIIKVKMIKEPFKINYN